MAYYSTHQSVVETKNTDAGRLAHDRVNSDTNQMTRGMILKANPKYTEPRSMAAPRYQPTTLSLTPVQRHTDICLIMIGRLVSNYFGMPRLIDPLGDGPAPASPQGRRIIRDAAEDRERRRSAPLVGRPPMSEDEMEETWEMSPRIPGPSGAAGSLASRRWFIQH